ncbi:MAG: C2H2-type zinc finger protein [Coriobacteriaceae bacterium]|uniref:C2H2-type zinc finger protein n=1 Tax=Tractidigestivibacter sp. TaxID=2847320 RepID=UPI002A833EF9|nr:C2H2-type zinc finger protein [Tractidigestivibacter sp.]MCI6547863.1 C2H2-type zinc finger protein [Coriobacteriaceae bacterium]MCI6844648.1 C2H2-type zinc finger protein [Coriobacteriaceae bacterium]MDD7584541.1 C2H2-type zinc finger protein [Coriobacteriaceae bacterium]MDY4535573.1 C2H2-type zinc finger protein [Tractidigestivibacter sp.]
MEQGNWPPEPEKAGTEGVETEDALGQRPVDAGDGQGEGTPAGARPGRRRRLGIAVAAVACGLGVAAAVALTQGSPSPDPVAEAPAAQTEQAEDATETDLTGDDVASIAETSLEYAGTDVSAGEGADVEVVADAGHVMVTQRSDDGAEARVEAAAKRSAALMSALSGRTVCGEKVADVTWVMADADGTARVAVRNTPESGSTAAAADPSADASMEAALEGSDGWAMDDGTHQGLEDGTSVPQSGGTTPTAPDGTEIVAPGDVESTDEAVDAESSGDDATDVPDGAANSSGGASSASETPSGSASSGTASSAQSSPATTPSGSTPSGQTSSGGSPSGSQQAHTHDWQPVYQSVWVQDSAAWDEPVYSTVVRYRCSQCGKTFDSLAELEAHGDAAHPDFYSYSTVSEKVQTGTKHHDATGHYEQQVTGYRCAGCGATK